MEVKILRESGWEEAMFGLSLSYNQPVEKMPGVARKLLPRGGSHIKFLESVVVWLDITAPRYWWQQFDTYRVGMTKQSGSTMHTLMVRPLTQEDFEEEIPPAVLDAVNDAIAARDFRLAKVILPESFLQQRQLCTNYKELRHIVGQRHNHRLPEWQVFVKEVLRQAERPFYLKPSNNIT